MQAIEVNNIYKSYGQRSIVSNLSFQVAEKEFVALVGPSGSGKSTILNMIGLLETIDKGEIKLFGKTLPKITSSRSQDLRKETINYLFQSFALISEQTVEENLLLALYFTKLSKENKQKKIKEVLEWLKMSHLLNEEVNTLSGGEQQRVAIARAVLKPGKIILADEPTGSLDEKMAQTVFQLIQELRDKYDKTIIMVTHDPILAQQTDRLIDLGTYSH